MANDDEKGVSTWDWSALVVGAAGIVQISAGVYLELWTTGSLGRGVGQWLVMQGSCDVVWAIRTSVGRCFNWADYILDKVVSIPFTVPAIGVQFWLCGGSENGSFFGRATVKRVARKVARKVGVVSLRGATVVLLGRILAALNDSLFDRLFEMFEAAFDGLFAREFADLAMHVERLYRVDPKNAETLVANAFAKCANEANEESSTRDRIRTYAIEFTPTVVELATLFFVSRTNFGDQAVDCVKFATFLAIAFCESRRVSRRFVKSLQETVSATSAFRRRGIPTRETSRGSDAVATSAATRIEWRAKRFVTRKFVATFRCGFVQASAQSFVPNCIAAAVDMTGL